MAGMGSNMHLELIILEIPATKLCNLLHALMCMMSLLDAEQCNVTTPGSLDVIFRYQFWESSPHCLLSNGQIYRSTVYSIIKCP